MSTLSHLDSEGDPQMVDVSGKSITDRKAQASIVVRLHHRTFDLVKNNAVTKGNVLLVAKIAGIHAAKKTSDLIPLCHSLQLSHVDLDFTMDEGTHTIRITSTVKASGRTGVEMEALTACSVAALTVYDMIKSVQKDVTIDELKLLEKTGGKSDDFHG